MYEGYERYEKELNSLKKICFFFLKKNGFKKKEVEVYEKYKKDKIYEKYKKLLTKRDCSFFKEKYKEYDKKLKKDSFGEYKKHEEKHSS